MNGEVVFIQLFDVGRYIDLNGIQLIFSGIRDKKKIKTKDTPDYIIIPETILLEIEQDIYIESKNFKKIKAQINLYEDGVVSVILRIEFIDLPLENIHTIRNIEINTHDGIYKIDEWISFQFNKIYELLKEYIDLYSYISEIPESEKYTCYCITDELKSTDEFIEENRKYLAAFLMGETPELDLHQNQINNTLKHPFSFLKK